MVFYKIYLDNIYQFDEFSLDLTYPRESVHSPIKQSSKKYPNLKFKKFLLLLGANASGKTTIGKGLCLIQNILVGRELSKSSLFNFTNYFKANIDSKIELGATFSTRKNMYRFNIIFDKNGVYEEKWKKIELKNQSYNWHEKELDSSNYIYEVNNKPGYYSYFIKEPNFSNESLEIHENMGYVYSFSGDVDKQINEEVGFDIKLFKQLIMSFDNSVKDVYASVEVENNIIIEFKNNHKEIILKNGSVSDEANSILSSGTKEAIYLAYMMTGLLKTHYQTLYFDEKMTNAHSEIEQQIIQILITMIDRVDGQVFVTSHNSDILNLTFPNYNYLLLKKNRDGTITKAIQPEKYVKHNNRPLRKIVEEDIFSTAPNLDELLYLHESISDKDE